MPYHDSEYPSILRGKDKRESQRLLAAAPEMLACLNAALAAFRELDDDWRGMDATLVDQIIANSRHAIADCLVRAEGEVEEMGHTVLVAFVVNATSHEEAQRRLIGRLPDPAADCHEVIDCWWIADDRRIDGNDNDSAVFVPFGTQDSAVKTLKRSDA